MKRSNTILTVLGLVCLFLASILAAVYLVGTDAGLYYREQMKADILPFAGVSEGDLMRLDDSLAAYLRGDQEAPDGLTVQVFGTEQPAFNQKELTHLQDCASLFDLACITQCILAGLGTLLVSLGAQKPHKLVTLLICAVFLLLGMFNLDRLATLIALILCIISLLQTRRPKPTWIAAALTLLPFTLFAVWACIDFDAAFTFFHQKLFTNDLWLLDSRTDLLIRICPESMFMDMGLRIALMSLAVIVGVPLVTTIASIVTKPSNARK